MADRIDSTAWTGDVEGRARTQAPLFTSDVKAEIRRSLTWGTVLGLAILSAVLIYQGAW